MTGPLAQEFAQVREGIGAVDADSGLIKGLIGREVKRVEDALAALASIERHVQDMSALAAEAELSAHWFEALLTVIKNHDKPLAMGIAAQAGGGEIRLAKLRAALPVVAPDSQEKGEA